MESNGRRRWLAALVGAPVGATLMAKRAQAAPAIDPTLDAVVSRDAIREVLFRYARGNDRKDEAMLRSCFWPESTHKHGAFEGASSDFVGYAMKVLHSIVYSYHYITNASIEVRGDRAYSECYYFAHHRRPKADGSGEEDAFFEGRYLDFHERRHGEWRIIRRRGLADLTSVVPAAKPYATWTPGVHGVAGPEDESYAMREAFRAGR
jgi:hypothetical protein